MTIGTPHRGSEFANDATRELGRRLIKLPEMMLELGTKLALTNPGFFTRQGPADDDDEHRFARPDCPIFPVMLKAPRPAGPRITTSSAWCPSASFLGSRLGRGRRRGLVQERHLDNVASEIVVPADHLEVHRHPLAILEVRRILLEHLAAIGARVPLTAGR